MNVGGERFQRRDVDDAHFVGQRRAQPFLKEIVERVQKRGERFARSGRRGDERVATFANGRPTKRLRARRLTERFGKPFANDGMEVIEGHGIVNGES